MYIQAPFPVRNVMGAHALAAHTVYPYREGCSGQAFSGTVQRFPAVYVRCEGVPLHYCLFAPELQWQPRGQRRFSLGNACVSRPEIEADELVDPEVPPPLRHLLFTPGFIVAVQGVTGYLTGVYTLAHLFDAGSVPLGYSGNPGVNGASHRGVNLCADIPSERQPGDAAAAQVSACLIYPSM